MSSSDRSMGVVMRERNRWRRFRSLIGVGAVLVVGAIVVGMLYLTGQFDAEDPLAEPAEHALTSPTEVPATPTIVATPEEDDRVYPVGSLPAMLAMAPDRIEDDDTGLPVEAAFADLAMWFELAAVDLDAASDAELEQLMRSLELPGVLRTRGFSPEWQDVYGFSVRDVDQIITIGHAPDQIVIMRGEFEPDMLYDTWVRNGYQAVEVEDTTVWSLFPGDRIDLTAPASRPALGLFNNVVVVEDDTLIAAARQSGMADVLRVISDDAPSLLDHGDLEQAVVSWIGARSPASVILADGTIFEVPLSGTSAAPDASEGSGKATPLAEAPLPEVELVVFGLMPDENLDAPATLEVMMLYDADRDAIGRVPAIVRNRAEAATTDDGTGSWIERARLVHVEVAGEEGSRVDARFELLAGPDAWTSLILDRELDLLSWSGDS